MLEAAGDILRLSLGVIFHPIDAFGYIKRNRDFFSYLPIPVMLIAIVAVRVGTIYIVHFPLSTLSPESTSFINEAFRFVLPIVGWAVSCYIMTAIMAGESLFREVLTASCYAMLPYVLFMIPIALLSRTFSRSEAGIYQLLNVAVWAWVFILFFTGVKILNDYTFGKTVFACAVSIIAMFVIVAVLLLVYAMLNQLGQIIHDIYTEIRMLNW